MQDEREHFIVDYRVVGYGNSGGRKKRVCKEDVGVADHCPRLTESEQTRPKRNRVGGKFYIWTMDEVEELNTNSKSPRR